MNGDGFDDVVVGASRVYEAEGRGRAAVVFGKRTVEEVELTALGTGGYWLKGRRQDAAGASVAGLGDLNGDRLDDLAIGAYRSDYNSRPNSGSAYVVYGKTGTGDVDLRSFGSWGYRIDGPWQGSNSGFPIASLGDMNGDGISDLAIGCYWNDVGYVVWLRA